MILKLKLRTSSPSGIVITSKKLTRLFIQPDKISIFFRNFHTLISLERVQMKSIQLLIVMTDQNHTYENLRIFYLSANV